MTTDEKLAVAISTIEDLLKHGAHEGRCDNCMGPDHEGECDYDCESFEDSCCYKHLAAGKHRDENGSRVLALLKGEPRG